MINKEKIDFFIDLINVEFDISLSSFDSDMNILYCSNGEEFYLKLIYEKLGFFEIIRQKFIDKNFHPLVIDLTLGIHIICCFDNISYDGEKVYILGPFLSDKDEKNMAQSFDEVNIPDEYKDIIIERHGRIPILTFSNIIYISKMLSYTINNQKIIFNDIEFISENVGEDQIFKENNEKDQIFITTHVGIWANEQRFLQNIKDGNFLFANTIDQALKLSGGIRANFENNIRKSKINVHTLLTLVSRAAIDGGLSPDISYSLNDHYSIQIEECTNEAQLYILSDRMLKDYVTRINESKIQSDVTPRIIEVCNYIDNNLDEKISLVDLSERFGYSQYYLTQKFNKEMKIPLNVYIMNKKIDYAKLQLITTNKPINLISQDLGFSNRTYFCTVFKKIIGYSPSEYRNNNFKV